MSRSPGRRSGRLRRARPPDTIASSNHCSNTPRWLRSFDGCCSQSNGSEAISYSASKSLGCVGRSSTSSPTRDGWRSSVTGRSLLLLPSTKASRLLERRHAVDRLPAAPEAASREGIPQARKAYDIKLGRTDSIRRSRASRHSPYGRSERRASRARIESRSRVRSVWSRPAATTAWRGGGGSAEVIGSKGCSRRSYRWAARRRWATTNEPSDDQPPRVDRHIASCRRAHGDSAT